MPTYDLRNTETGEEKEVICSYDSMKEMTESGEWEQFHKSTAKIVTGVGGTLKQTSEGWKDILRQTKRYSGRGNTIKV
jgi:hypothetical protein